MSNLGGLAHVLRPWPYMSPHVDTSFGDLGDNEFLRVSKVLHEHNRSARPVKLDNNA